MAVLEPMGQAAGLAAGSLVAVVLLPEAAFPNECCLHQTVQQQVRHVLLSAHPISEKEPNQTHKNQTDVDPTRQRHWLLEIEHAN